MHLADALLLTYLLTCLPLTTQMHYVVIDLKTEHVGHSIRPYLYLGMHAGIYSLSNPNSNPNPNPNPNPRP